MTLPSPTESEKRTRMRGQDRERKKERDEERKSVIMREMGEQKKRRQTTDFRECVLFLLLSFRGQPCEKLFRVKESPGYLGL